MNLGDLLAGYGVIGLGCAVAVLRRAPALGSRTAASALATVFVWPLWAPFALAAMPRVGMAAQAASSRAVERIERALSEAVEAVAGTPMGEVFSPRTARRIAAEVTTVALRVDELSAHMARLGFDPHASALRLEALEAAGAPERVVATARMQRESLSRLQQLRARDAQALEELAELLEALRAQLLLARYSGSPTEGADAIVGEVWARLEGLGAAFDSSGESHR